MIEKNLKELLEKYNENSCSQEELQLLENWISLTVFPEHQISEEELESDLIEIEVKLPIVKKQRYLWVKLAAAASIILVAIVGYYSHYLSPKPKHLNKIQYVNDVVPGRNSATLTLANGKKIILDDSQIGRIAGESGMQILKTHDGQLIYEIKEDKKSYSLNKLSTAKGETYKVRLPDGTLVALNSESSLTYGTTVNAKGQRYVELTGEGYFEVAKDVKHPFIVKTGKQEVQVLGTHFNISNYSEDKIIKTTLLEGKVKVSSELFQQIATLTPGQQAILSTQNFHVEDKVDLEEVIAWKNGYFKFNGSLVEIMAKVARWYDVEVIYQFKPEESLAFGAEISMQRNLSDLLKIIESTGNVRFKIEGRRVFVMK